jgi:hypothetical protein
VADRAFCSVEACWSAALPCPSAAPVSVLRVRWRRWAWSAPPCPLVVPTRRRYRGRHFRVRWRNDVCRSGRWAGPSARGQNHRKQSQRRNTVKLRCHGILPISVFEFQVKYYAWILAPWKYTIHLKFRRAQTGLVSLTACHRSRQSLVRGHRRRVYLLVMNAL